MGKWVQRILHNACKRSQHAKRACSWSETKLRVTGLQIQTGVLPVQGATHRLAEALSLLQQAIVPNVSMRTAGMST
jgi:hypothetical protein